MAHGLDADPVQTSSGTVRSRAGRGSLPSTNPGQGAEATEMHLLAVLEARSLGSRGQQVSLFWGLRARTHEEGPSPWLARSVFSCISPHRLPSVRVSLSVQMSHFIMIPIILDLSHPNDLILIG